MDENELHAIATKSVKGVFALVSRSFLIQLLGVASSVVLTLYLEPETFGTFFVVSSIIVFFNYFQDIGLAASLIQKKEEPTKTDLRTVFTIQQALVLCLVVPAILLSGNLASFYKLGESGHILLVVLLISFFLTSLRTIPPIILERKLDYNRLVVPQVLENITYNATLVICAISGLGVTSFILAVLFRSIIGLVATYGVQSWPIGLGFDKKSFKSLISFGIPFQTNSILALFKDDFLTIFLGGLLPKAQLGYIGFAQRVAYLPLRLVMDNIIKITFPSFARLQDDRPALKIAIEKSIFLIAFAIFPVAAGIIAYSPYLIDFIPRYHKWEPAIMSIMFFSLGSVISSVSTPLTNFLNAIGKVKVTLYFMIFWTIMIWGTTLILIPLMGYNGVAAASFAVALTSVGVFFVARRYVEFSAISTTYKQFLAAILMFGFSYVTSVFVTSFLMMVIFGILSLGVYAGAMFFMAREELTKTLVFVVKAIRAKK